jgi:hypothetical protein
MLRNAHRNIRRAWHWLNNEVIIDGLGNLDFRKTSNQPHKRRDRQRLFLLSFSVTSACHGVALVKPGGRILPTFFVREADYEEQAADQDL